MQVPHAGGATDAGNAWTIETVVGLREASHTGLSETSHKRAFVSTRAFKEGRCQAEPDLPTTQIYHTWATSTMEVGIVRHYREFALRILRHAAVVLIIKRSALVGSGIEEFDASPLADDWPKVVRQVL
jgi:hypothetical protein